METKDIKEVVYTCDCNQAREASQKPNNNKVKYYREQRSIVPTKSDPEEEGIKYCIFCGHVAPSTTKGEFKKWTR